MPAVLHDPESTWLPKIVTETEMQAKLLQQIRHFGIEISKPPHSHPQFQVQPQKTHLTVASRAAINIMMIVHTFIFSK